MTDSRVWRHFHPSRRQDMKCPRCGGPMWDNRATKKSDRHPDYKCKDKDCVDPKSGYTTAVWADDEPEQEPHPEYDVPPPPMAGQPARHNPRAVQKSDELEGDFAFVEQLTGRLRTIYDGLGYDLTSEATIGDIGTWARTLYLNQKRG